MLLKTETDGSDIVDVVYDAMDEFLNSTNFDMSCLSKELQDYGKTANVILGVCLHFDLWIEV